MYIFNATDPSLDFLILVTYLISRLLMVTLYCPLGLLGSKYRIRDIVTTIRLIMSLFYRESVLFCPFVSGAPVL